MTCFGDGQLLDGNGGSAGCVAYNTNAYRTGTAVIGPTVKTQINYTAVEAGEDPAGFFNLATDVATIPHDGNWTITSTIELITAAAGVCFHTITINQGVSDVDYSVSSAFPGSAAYVNLTCAITKLLTAGDLVRFWVQQNTGFNATLNGTARRVNASITSSCIP